MSQSENKKIRVKVKLDTRTIVWRYKSIQLSELKDFVRSKFKLYAGTFSLKYEDDESDLIDFDTNEDLYEAFNIAQQQQRKSLKIIIKKEVLDLSSSPILIPKTESNANTNSNNSNTNQHIPQQVNTQMDTASMTTTSLHTIPSDKGQNHNVSMPTNIVGVNNNLSRDSINDNIQTDIQSLSKNINNNNNENNHNQMLLDLANNERNNTKADSDMELEEVRQPLQFSNNNLSLQSSPIQLSQSYNQINQSLSQQQSTQDTNISINNTNDTMLNDTISNNNDKFMDIDNISNVSIHHSNSENNNDNRIKKKTTKKRKRKLKRKRRIPSISSISSNEDNDNRKLRKRKTFICYTCNKTFASKHKKITHKCIKFPIDIEKHIHEHENELSTSSSTPPLESLRTCNHCNKQFINGKALGGHLSGSKCGQKAKRNNICSQFSDSDTNEYSSSISYCVSDNYYRNTTQNVVSDIDSDHCDSDDRPIIIKKKSKSKSKRHEKVKKKKKRNYKAKYRNKDGSKRHPNMRLDEALKDTENQENWSQCRKSAWDDREKNPEKFFYRFNKIGENTKNGKWNEYEEELFLNRAKEFGVNSKWGMFSKVIYGRNGYLCSNKWRSLMKVGKVRDANYYKDLKKNEWYFKWGKNSIRKKKEIDNDLIEAKRYSFEIYEMGTHVYKHEKYANNFKQLEDDYKDHLSARYCLFKFGKGKLSDKSGEPSRKRRRK